MSENTSSTATRKNCFIVACVAILIYLNSLDNPFLNWDDLKLVTHNPDIKTTPVWELFIRPSGKAYLPFRTLSYALDYYLWGLNPVGYHITNLLLHCGSGILVLLIVTKLAGGIPGLIASLLFVSHPCGVEAVSWISGRRDTLSTFFALLAFWLYARRRYHLSILSAVVALFSKPTAVVLAPLLFLHEFFSGKRKGWLLRLAPFFVLSLVSAGLHYAVGSTTGVVKGSTGSRLPSLPLVLWEYLRLFFFPLHLRAIYDTRPVIPQESLRVILPVLGCVVVIVFLLSVTSRLKGFWVGWFLFSLLPVLQFVPTSMLTAERYLYLASAGLCGWMGEQLQRTKLWVILVVLFAGMVVWRNNVWSSPETLWRDALLKSPDSAVTHQNYASTLLRRSNPVSALKRFQQANFLLPTQPEPLIGLGDTYKQLGDIERATVSYRRARSLSPDSPEPLTRLARLLIEHDDVEGAFNCLDRARQIAPDNPSVLFLSGLVAERTSPRQAQQFYLTALSIDPDRPAVHYNLGSLLLKIGDLERARHHLEEALRLQPSHAEAKANLAVIYIKDNRPEEAENLLHEALKLKPKLWRARATLGGLYLKTGRKEKAVSELKRAYEASAQNPSVKKLLDHALSETGAIAHPQQ